MPFLSAGELALPFSGSWSTAVCTEPGIRVSVECHQSFGTLRQADGDSFLLHPQVQLLPTLLTSWRLMGCVLLHFRNQCGSMWDQKVLTCGMAFSLCPTILSQTAARHGLGDSKAQGLKNSLGAAVGDETVQLYGCRWLYLCPSQGGRWLPALLACEFRCGQFRQTGPWGSSLPWPGFCAGWSLGCSQEFCTSQISS